jgi:sugar phosphate isomerase/epimerase
VTVYASTACVPGIGDLWATLDAYRGAGLRSVELGSSTVEDADGDLAERLTGERLDFVIHNYFPPPRDSFVLNLASPDREIVERSLAFVLNTLELAARVGAPLYSVHGGFVTDPVGFDGTSFEFPEPESPHAAQQAQERFVEALSRPLARAEELGVLLLVENNVCTERHVGKLLLSEPREFISLFESVPSPALGALIDFGHLNVSARVLGFERLEMISAMGTRIGAFHVHDNSGLADEHRPVAPESWVLEVLRQPDFAGLPITVEARFPDVAGLAAHVRWLERELPSVR